MTWHAIVPLKPPGQRKTRLGLTYSPLDRDRLALAMFRHVTTCLSEAGANVVVLASVRPEGWDGALHVDGQTGLNPELAHVRRRLGLARCAVVHADLPLLRPRDVLALFEMAEKSGLAVAPDRHGTGTNAVALLDGRQFQYQFGASSLARFLAEAGSGAALVHSPGLSIDIDTIKDIAAVNTILSSREVTNNCGTASSAFVLPPVGDVAIL